MIKADHDSTITHVEAAQPKFRTNLPENTVRERSLDPMGSPLHSLVNIRVIKNDTRTLASQLQCHDFEIALCRRLQYLASRDGAPSERNLLNERMMADRVTYGVAWVRRR